MQSAFDCRSNKRIVVKTIDPVPGGGAVQEIVCFIFETVELCVSDEPEPHGPKQHKNQIENSTK